MTDVLTFSFEADPELVQELRDIAAREGRELQAVLGDALREYAAYKRRGLPSRTVLDAFQASLEERGELYQALAK